MFQVRFIMKQFLCAHRKAFIPMSRDDLKVITSYRPCQHIAPSTAHAAFHLTSNRSQSGIFNFCSKNYHDVLLRMSSIDPPIMKRNKIPKYTGKGIQTLAKGNSKVYPVQIYFFFISAGNIRREFGDNMQLRLRRSGWVTCDWTPKFAHNLEEIAKVKKQLGR
jgi:hypothetical protein